MKKKILVVDDHPIVQQGYAQLVSTQPDLEVCGFADCEKMALEKAEETEPDLAIVDISLKNSHGIDLIHSLLARRPNVKILVISAHDENLFAERALDIGAMGYINKQEATDRLIDGLRCLLNDDIYLSESLTRRMLKRRTAGGKLEQKTGARRLTDRELQVYQSIGQGMTTRQIADQLFLSPKTIERYKENIKQKMEIDNATELVQHATRWVMENL